MYEAFFGFRKRPFDLVPDPDFLFLGESHDSALANLQLGIESGKGFVVITGGVGTGKTTVLRAVLRRIGREMDVAFLNQPDLDVNELLRTILEEFEVAMPQEDKVTLRRRLRDTLVDRDRPAILVIDEAHLLSEESLEQVRLLSNFEESDRKLLQIVLAGQPELKELLSRPRLRPLAQRIEMFYEIRPLAPGETAAYVNRRVQIAGNPDDLRFEPRALADIHARTGGVPRLINLLAERALITAYVAGTKTIDSKIVRDAFEDLGEVTQRVMVTGEPDAQTFAPPVKSALPEAQAPPRIRGRWDPVTDEPQTDEAIHKRKKRRFLAGFGVGGVLMIALISLGTRHALSSKPGREIKGEVASTSQAVPAEAAVEGSATNPDPADVLPAAAPPPEKRVDASADSAKAASRTRESSGPVAAEASPSPRALPERTMPDEAPQETRFAIQCGSFRDAERARELASRVAAATGEEIRVAPAEMASGTWYRVLLGSFQSEDDAIEHLADVREEGDALVLQVVRVSPSELARRSGTE